eukprot:TRINITY_DN44153_c0_g1_i1.p1 TRINITY_DN44153_c0_g1~~TRINITY_DN44153_c0_g1_i1.p1  ORF type:complete len:1307 (+),score=203.04 TRINITY_DN44153_c0_g1_i1:52-3921(+)
MARSRIRRSRPRAEAVAHLQELVEVLYDTPQGEGSDEIAERVREAAEDGFVSHPEREVRLGVAVCLAEGLRVFAPDTLLDNRQMRAAIGLFLEQLSVLGDARGSGPPQRVLALLERLAQVNVFVLLTQFDDAEALISSLVDVCFGAAKRWKGSHFEVLLGQILVSVFQETDVVPAATLVALLRELHAPTSPLATVHSASTSILSQPLEDVTVKQRATGLPADQDVTGARGHARRILGYLARKRAAQQVNELIIGALANGGDDACVLGGPHSTENDGVTATELLDIIYELYTVNPALADRILPHLHAELQSVDVERRHGITRLVGRLLAHDACQRGSLWGGVSTAVVGQKPLATSFPSLREQFLKRLEDLDESVRLAALEGVLGILRAVASVSVSGHRAGFVDHNSLTPAVAPSTAASSIVNVLESRCLDPSDVVRLQVVHIAVEVAMTSLEGVKLMHPVLPVILRRIMDKRPDIRETCAVLAARLYSQHALPSWIDGRQETGLLLNCIPQLMCEAYAVFVGGRAGYTGQLEKLIEEHLLGCTLPLDARQRGLAFAGFYACVSGSSPAVQGLDLLLSRKRDANHALLQYLRHRCEKNASIAEESVSSEAIVPCHSEATGLATYDGPVPAAALEVLARFSPEADDKTARIESLLFNLRQLDAVRNSAFWMQLDRLCFQSSFERSEDLPGLMMDFENLLRVHHLVELTALLRRAILKLWMLSDQARALLDIWIKAESEALEEGEGQAKTSTGAVRRGLGRLMAKMPKMTPDAFLPHAEEFSRRIVDGTLRDIPGALRVLAALGKNASASFDSEGKQQSFAVDCGSHLAALQKAVARLGEQQLGDEEGPSCRRVVRSLDLLTATDQAHCLDQLLRRAEELLNRAPCNEAVALHLASSCLQRMIATSFDFQSFTLSSLVDLWITRARSALASSSQTANRSHCAAMTLCSSVPTQEGFISSYLHSLRIIGNDAASMATDVGLVGVTSVLRGLRHGFVPLSTDLLTILSSQISAALASDRSDVVSELLFNSMQKLHKRSTTSVDLSDRLRLRTTIPTLFAAASTKKHRDGSQRLLQAALANALRQSSSRREPLLDLSVACFLHFLSRLGIFLQEASAKNPAYRGSSKYAAFFVEALFRVDPRGGSTLAVAALQVCDKVRFFVDRERPTSDGVHKAAYVLRHVLERRCPEIVSRKKKGDSGSAAPEASTVVGMPTDLFVLWQPQDPASQTASQNAIQGSVESHVAVTPTTTPKVSPEPIFGNTGNSIAIGGMDAASDKMSPSAAKPIKRRRKLSVRP